MGISVRTRFEVFKRDRFTCHYCGRTIPPKSGSGRPSDYCSDECRRKADYDRKVSAWRSRRGRS